jgi:hypothetical protein
MITASAKQSIVVEDCNTLSLSYGNAADKSQTTSCTYHTSTPEHELGNLDATAMLNNRYLL